ncbi:hypothetical protein NDU88_003377 [Pleurodeles waltl]|uniref:Uncharacterized protein n=1 Tax=Pleurodeles waltl TaxID=8319 RepID=A0AAV7NI14_PLEWA|nr:hypothetical protein NDU88_003377 [Pleurodeles waltl]
MSKNRVPSSTAHKSTMDKNTRLQAGVHDSGGAQKTDHDNAALLTAITQSRFMLDANINAVDSEVIPLHQDLWNAEEGISETDTRVSKVEDIIEPLQEKVTMLMTLSKELAAQIEDLEGCVHSSNLWFVGFPEGFEGDTMDKLLAKWITTLMPPDSLASCFVIQHTL